MPILDPEDMLKLLNGDIERYRNVNRLKKYYPKFRQQNFDSNISENLAIYALLNLGIPAEWAKGCDVKAYIKGDWKKIEIKGFSKKNSPTSFGPKESWDYLIFVDCTRFFERKFKILMYSVSNTSEIWKKLPINKKETFHTQASNKRRPRQKAESIFDYLHDNGIKQKVLFDGVLSDLIKTKQKVKIALSTNKKRKLMA